MIDIAALEITNVYTKHTAARLESLKPRSAGASIPTLASDVCHTQTP